jgi:hypothetical protein
MAAVVDSSGAMWDKYAFGSKMRSMAASMSARVAAGGNGRFGTLNEGKPCA